MNQPHLPNNYLQQLPTANPIRNKSPALPKSIFPLFSLPQFKYSHQEIDLAPSFSSKDLKEIHTLQQTTLSKLFQNPLFQTSTRFNIKANNTRFASLRASYSEAGIHNNLPTEQQIGSQIQFESRFESGNLAFVVKGQSQNEYNLLLQKDINTTRCTQWFFFRVRNKKTTGRFKFNIINLLKNYSSYEYGMKISFCNESNSYTWNKGGQDINYLKNNIKISEGKSYYTLSFTFNFEKQDDTTFFAHSPPYTFTMLDTYLLKFTNSPDYTSIYKRKTLTESPCGNYVDQITITNFKSRKEKKVVFITARVHPGQTPSSFVCQGIIDFLLSNSQQAKKLRQHFVFKIVPMLNPDGVINGSYRCSLSGYDLNRVWNYDNKISSPEIYFTKRAILDEQKIFLFIDLHAHSKKKGAFMYGCQSRNSPFMSRHIPYLFWKQISHFNFYQCNFGMKQGREGTSRLCIHRLTNIPYSYTMQISFCSPIKEKYHFTVKHYKQIGYQLCLALKKYFCAREQYVSQVLKELYDNKQLAQIGKEEDEESSDDSQLDQPTEFKEIIENQRTFRRKDSNFRSKILETSVDKPAQKSYSRNVSPRKTYYPIQNIQSLISKEMPLKTKRQLEVEIPIINLQGNLQKQVKGEEVFLSTRLFKKEKEESPQKILNIQPLVLKSIPRYEFQEMQRLNNLFLPSLTSASYKRYAKKKNYPNQVIQVGTKYLQNHGLLKQEIRSVSRKKPGPKEQILSYL